jgi:hypothetical protein
MVQDIQVKLISRVSRGGLAIEEDSGRSVFLGEHLVAS